MRTPFSRPIMSGLVAMGVTSAASAISLSNFTPRIENLPSTCQGAYTSQIDGCVAGDFSPGARCSASCVSGLVKISQLVSKQCADVDVPETSIIGVFLLGQGIPALCPGVAVTTIGSSSSTQAPPPQTSQAQESSSQAPPPPPPSTTQEAQPSSTGGIDTDPNTTLATSVANSPNSPVAPPTSASSATASQTASSQKSNTDSGGGSPFDVVATGSSSPLRLIDFTVATLVGVAALAAAVL